MSDWQVGDFAVCVDVEWRECGGKLHMPRVLKVGQVRRVTAVVPADCGSCIGLVFDDGIKAIAQRFRRVCPDKHEACEEEFVTLLKRKPVEHIIGCDGDD